MSSTSTSTTSRSTIGLTPAGVPVRMMSPGRRVNTSETYETRYAASKIICDVRPSCFVSPLTRARTYRSSTSQAGHDPRADRARAVEPLPAGPLGVGPLGVASGDVALPCQRLVRFSIATSDVIADPPAELVGQQAQALRLAEPRSCRRRRRPGRALARADAAQHRLAVGRELDQRVVPGVGDEEGAAGQREGPCRGSAAGWPAAAARRTAHRRGAACPSPRARRPARPRGASSACACPSPASCATT